MLRKIIIPLAFLAPNNSYSQARFAKAAVFEHDTSFRTSYTISKQFTATAEFLDAAINFINSFTK